MISWSHDEESFGSLVEILDKPFAQRLVELVVKPVITNDKPPNPIRTGAAKFYNRVMSRPEASHTAHLDINA